MYTCTKEYKKNYYTVIYAVDLFYKILRFLLFFKIIGYRCYAVLMTTYDDKQRHNP